MRRDVGEGGKEGAVREVAAAGARVAVGTGVRGGGQSHRPRRWRRVCAGARGMRGWRAGWPCVAPSGCRRCRKGPAFCPVTTPAPPARLLRWMQQLNNGTSGSPRLPPAAKDWRGFSSVGGHGRILAYAHILWAGQIEDILEIRIARWI